MKVPSMRVPYLCHSLPRPTRLVSRSMSLSLQLAYAGFALTGMGTVVTAYAQTMEIRSYSIPAGPLNPSLNRFMEESGTFLAGSAQLTEGKRTAGLQGRYTVREGLAALLKGSGLEAVERDGNFVLQVSAAPVTGGNEAVLPLVSVTASPISDSGLPSPYAGGQVARGSRIGFLGNKDFMDTPFNVTSYTADTIQNQQARTIGDVVKNDPSVRTVWPDSSYISQFNIRGFPTQTQDMAVNGLYGIVPPQMTGGLESVERVEILKGPNALLNGMSPTGGIGGNINLVTKRATNAPVTQITTSYYSDAQIGTSVDLGRRFGTEQEWGVRFNGAYRDGRTGISSQSQRANSGTLGLDYRGDRLRVSADLGIHEMRTDAPTRVAFTDNANFQIPSAPDSRLNFGQPWYFAKSNDHFGMAQGEFDITPDVTAYAAFGARKNTFLGLYNFIYLQNAQGDFRANQYFQPTYANAVTSQVGLKGRFDTGSVKHEVNLSFTTLHTESGALAPVISTYTSNMYNPLTLAPPTNLSAFADTAPKTAGSDLNSVALADTLHFFDDKLQLTLGARQQNIKVANFSAVTGAQTSLYSQSKLTPAAAVLIKLTPAASLYGNYIEGLSQGPTAPAGTANVGAMFAPVASKQYEAGMKFDFGRFASTFSVFQIQQPSGFTNPATNIYSVNGEQRNRGVEINTFGELAAGVRLLGGVSFIRGELTKTAGGTLDGKTAIGVPTTQLNFGGEWDTPFAPGLTLTGRGIYTSSQYYNAANTQSIPSWTRLDLGARYKTNIANAPFTLRASIENLFGKDYWAATSSSFGLARGAPRTLLVSGTVDF
jgi:iron complex outermembrane receptor protein